MRRFLRLPPHMRVALILALIFTLALLVLLVLVSNPPRYYLQPQGLGFHTWVDQPPSAGT